MNNSTTNFWHTDYTDYYKTISSKPKKASPQLALDEASLLLEPLALIGYGGDEIPCLEEGKITGVLPCPLVHLVAQARQFLNHPGWVIGIQMEGEVLLSCVRVRYGEHRDNI